MLDRACEPRHDPGIRTQDENQSALGSSRWLLVAPRRPVGAVRRLHEEWLCQSDNRHRGAGRDVHGLATISSALVFQELS